MKQLLGLLSILAFLLSIASCKNDSIDNIGHVKWLSGKWESKTPDGTLYENWERLNDSVMKGHAFAIADGDTTFSEQAYILRKNGVLVYSVTVNEEQTTDFTLVSAGEEAVFENLQHDYPQRIIYTKPVKDSLFARIEGVVDGVYTKEDFSYKRSN